MEVSIETLEERINVFNYAIDVIVGLSSELDNISINLSSHFHHVTGQLLTILNGNYELCLYEDAELDEVSDDVNNAYSALIDYFNLLENNPYFKLNELVNNKGHFPDLFNQKNVIEYIEYSKGEIRKVSYGTPKHKK